MKQLFHLLLPWVLVDLNDFTMIRGLYFIALYIK